MSQNLIEMFDVGEVTVVRYFDSSLPQDLFEQKDEISKPLRWLTEEMGRRYILFSFQEVLIYFGSLGISKFLDTQKKLAARQGKLVLSILNEDDQGFSAYPVRTWLTVVGSEEEGLRLLERFTE